MPQVFVTGIGTAVGKTVVSAALVELWQADYWKPVQSGTSQGSDSEFIATHTSYSPKIHKEAYSLKAPLSPHAAAELERTVIDPEVITMPKTVNNLVVEGAGGLFVPLHENFFIIDLIEALKLPVILVSRHYLGSINHTLLSIEALQARKITMYGLVFIGDENCATERVITARIDTRIARIPLYKTISKTVIREMLGILHEFQPRLTQGIDCIRALESNPAVQDRDVM